MEWKNAKTEKPVHCLPVLIKAEPYSNKGKGFAFAIWNADIEKWLIANTSFDWLIDFDTDQQEWSSDDEIECEVLEWCNLEDYL